MPKSTGARLLVAILAYSAVQVLLRLLVGPSLELDEAEAYFQARHLAWGYGPQPPLYFWLQWGLFQVLGEGLLALALLKALILGATVAGVFALLRRDAGAGPAAVAALSLSLLPEVVWEGQRALTHTMLALLMAVVVTGLLVRALESGRWREHLALGVALGLALLSKLNVALWPVGLLVAAALLPEWRRKLRWPRMMLAAAVALAVVAPVGLWMLENPVLATGSVHKLDIAGAGGPAARLEGTRDLLMAVLTFLATAVLVLLSFAARTGGRGLRPGPVARLLGLAVAASLLVLWLGLLVSGATEIAVRWLLPLAWGVVPATVLTLWPRLERQAKRAFVGIVGGLWLAVVPLLPYASLVDPGYRGADFAPLIERLQDLGAPGRPVEVADQWLAGNLAHLAPDMAVSLRTEGDRPETGAVVVTEVAHPGEDEVLVRRGHRMVSLATTVMQEPGFP